MEPEADRPAEERKAVTVLFVIWLGSPPTAVTA
jgi:hypothetical protein